MAEDDRAAWPGGDDGRDFAVHRLEASVDEGIQLLQAFRAISSPEIRAQILTLVATQARRRSGRASH